MKKAAEWQPFLFISGNNYDAALSLFNKVLLR